jgi:hypothetical protein
VLLILVLGISHRLNQAFASGPYIVNSVGDAPDSDPSDDVCDTGMMLGAPVDVPECALCATNGERSSGELHDETFGTN